MATIVKDPAAADVPAGVPANRDRLFLASCVALIVTAMTFAIRAGILNELQVDFALDNSQLGWVNSMAFFGFPIAMLVGGLVYNTVGPRIMMWIAFGCHVLGLGLTIVAGGFLGLLVSTFFIGFANGSVEAACNPMIADMYPDKRTEMLNKFHVWFPGGIVIGSLVAQSFGTILPVVSWQVLIAVMFIPTVIYGVLILGQEFPRSLNIEADTGSNVAALLTPLFLFIGVCMLFTAASEFATTQWVEKILGGSGAQPILVLALVSGVMAVGRYFGGPYVHRFSTGGVLLASAILTTVGIYLLSTLVGSALYFAAFIFALGVCFFWPNMIATTSVYTPRTGALGMSVIGGFGMLSMVILNPIIGGWLDEASSRPGVVTAAMQANDPSFTDTGAIYAAATAAKAARDSVEKVQKDLIRAREMPDFITYAANASVENLGITDADEIEEARERAIKAAEVVAGREVLSFINFIPLIAIGLLAALFFWTRGIRPATAEVATAIPTPASAR